MNLMFVGKYPPIQGGESTKLFWLARRLSQRGHRVTIITNFQELHDRYKTSLSQDEMLELQAFGVKVRSTFDHFRPAFIPGYDLYVERLASLVIECAEEEKPDLIIGWYLLPYALAACLAAGMLNIRWLYQHAGSDLCRLLPHAYINAFLERVVRSAYGVLTYPATVRTFQSIGCKRVFLHRPQYSPEYCATGPRVNPLLDERRFVLFLGAVSPGKGIFYLMDGFAKLETDAILAIVGNVIDEQNQLMLDRAIERLGSKAVRCIRAVPPWQIPAIMRAAEMIVVPEHGFSVPIHRSRVPVETLLCGKRPIVSEGAAKLYEPSLVANMQSVDVANSKALSDKLAENLADNERGRISESERQAIVEKVCRFDDYVAEMEEHFANAAS